MPVISLEDSKRAVLFDITIEQGTDLDLPITIQDINPSGYWGMLQVRAYKESPEVLFEMSTDAGTIVCSSTVTLKFAAADFVGATWRDGWYDLKLKTPGATPKATRVMEGNFYIDLENTR
jgi:hypothetical protein